MSAITSKGIYHTGIYDRAFIRTILNLTTIIYSVKIQSGLKPLRFEFPYEQNPLSKVS